MRGRFRGKTRGPKAVKDPVAPDAGQGTQARLQPCARIGLPGSWEGHDPGKMLKPAELIVHTPTAGPELYSGWGCRCRSPEA